MNITRHLRIAGHVQGVGYRHSLCAEAQANRVSGWVRNRRDGTVEAVLQGSPEAVERTLAWAKRGPPGARVTAVEVRDAGDEFDRPYGAFEQLPSA